MELLNPPTLYFFIDSMITCMQTLNDDHVCVHQFLEKSGVRWEALSY